MRGNQRQPVIRARGSGKEDRIQRLTSEFRHRFFGFFYAQIGQQHSIDTRLRCNRSEALKSEAKQGIEIAEQDQRDLRLCSYLPDRLEHTRQSLACTKGAL
jgi:hypothetical protein